MTVPAPTFARSEAPPGLGAGGRFDPSRVRPAGPRDALRTFAAGARLGWQIESNWADPLLFFIYSVSKPVFALLILVVMLEVIAGRSNPAFRAFVVVGSALWSFVTSGLAGLATSVLDDRERYRALKYVYVAPGGFLVFLLGRGTARLAVGAVGAAITLLLGVGVLGVPFDPWRVDWPVFVVAMALGVASVLAGAIMLAGVCLQIRQEAWSYPEAVAGAAFLVTGAVFPLAVLPGPIQAFGLLVPLTWWLEAVRRALFPEAVSALGGPGSVYTLLTGRAAPAAAEVLVALLATGALVTLAAVVVFRISERRAKERGLLDQTTGS